MSKLLYREDMDEVRKRLTTWWNGGDIGRPAMQILAPREKPLKAETPPMPKPEGWLTDYSTSNFEYRVDMARRCGLSTHYLAEAVPNMSPDLAPNCLALYLGCRGIEQPGTVFCEPCIKGPESATFKYDPENFYWDFTQRLTKEYLKIGKGKFLLQFPDLIEGLDTLAAMRGTQDLLFDLIERPEWVHGSLKKITSLYFKYYDQLYDMMKDETGGSMFWAWAPGRMAKLQCDFSAMISPDMFGEFMVPVLKEMTARFDHCMYHWDGPGAIPHHDHLLSLSKLSMIQWTPGAGAESVMDKRWWPLYHKTIEAGKKVFLYADDDIQNLQVLKKEFGKKLRQFMFCMDAKSVKHAEEILAVVSR